MTRHFRILLALSLAGLMALPAAADDKDFLRPVDGSAPPNLLIVFGNSQTLTQTISFTGVNFSTFDGDGDSPGSKMGSAKRVVQQFVFDNQATYNIGLTGFSRPPNTGGIDINRKHWVYVAAGTVEPRVGNVDYPGDSFAEPVGTMERWGLLGEGPCTTKTVPDCSDRSPRITLDSAATVIGPFFGPKGDGQAIINHPGSDNDRRIRITIDAGGGEYGEAYTDGTFSALVRGDHAIRVLKEYQKKDSASPTGWTTIDTPALNPGAVHVLYVPLGAPVPPAVGAPDPTLFFPAGTPDAGQAVGFMNDAQVDFNVNSNCSGWDFQINSGQVPLVKIPRDYFWGPTCEPPQNSLPCVERLLRPQAYIARYDPVSGNFSTTDPDNPGYTTGVDADKYADGCDPDLLGAVQNGLDHIERNVLLTSRNGSQAPIKNILDNILAYFSDPKHDGFKNGARLDDPNAQCRNSAVIFIYDTFNGCQNNTCSQLKTFSLTKLKAIGIPVYTIGFGEGVNQGPCAGDPDDLTEACPLVCIPKNTGAVKQDGTSPGYFPVNSPEELYIALTAIANLVNESQKGFVSSTVSSAQVSGEQVTFLATFNALNLRSIWNGRINAYKLDPSGNLQFGERTIRDVNDPNFERVVPAPKNTPDSLIWNAGENLADTPGRGATVSSEILSPGAAREPQGVYTDLSNDSPSEIKTSFYPGRKIVFSLPQSYPDPPTTLPLPAADAVPENRLDMVAPAGDPPYSSPPTYWPALKALLSPQTGPPFVLTPPIADDDARDSLRFIWGDRDAIICAAEPSAAKTTKIYGDADDDCVTDGVGGLKLGDIFHSSPVVVGGPNDFASFVSNLNNYQAFRTTYQRRRRVLYAGANDGLLHAFDAGAWDRTPTQCDFEDTNGNGTQDAGEAVEHCYDLGTGAELFAFAPRSIMQIFRGLKNDIGVQTKRIEWTVDGPPTAGDVFIDSSHSGTADPGPPDPADRAWHTVLIGGMREGSAFEGLNGASPFESQGSYYALDITQPDELGADSNGVPITVTPGSFDAPRCLNDSGGAPPGHATCGKDAADPAVRGNQPARAWPTVLWEITDTGDQDAALTPGATYADMGESWSKPALGRVRVCTADCGTSGPTTFPTTEDRYVAIFGGGFDRERLNRRGNWLYMVDVETGKVLYRANSSCGINAGGGCSSPVYFASIPSEPAAIDANGDGIIDLLYFGDLKGRMWRVDLTDLRLVASSGRFDNKIDMDAGSGKPFLLFDAPQPVAPAIHPFYPIYYRPTVISLGFNVGGKPALGIGFGTGDRDDITSTLEPLALTFKQRFYYVVDRNNSVTRTESDLFDIVSATAPSLTTAPDNGWFIELALGERVNADMMTSSGVIFFTTFNPLMSGNPTAPCPANVPKCGLANGTARLYRVFYSTGNPYLGSDRGETQEFGGFLSEPVYFQSRDQQGNVIYTTENTVKKEKAPGSKKTTVKSWKERSRRP
jgi:Tfp pilus tip-associated adhesin PilY1